MWTRGDGRGEETNVVAGIRQKCQEMQNVATQTKDGELKRICPGVEPKLSKMASNHYVADSCVFRDIQDGSKKERWVVIFK